MDRESYYSQHIEERKEYQRRYEQNKKLKDPVLYLQQIAKRVKKWRKENPIKNSAHKRVFVELRAERIRKFPCFMCGNEKSEAHHGDYSKPLDIIWVCKLHHKMADKGKITI
jgi:hypothetical protein